MGHDTEIRQRRGFGDTNFVLFARDAAASATAPAPLPEVTYWFDAQGEHESPWKALRFTASEGLSSLYECVIDVANAALTANPDALLGKYALLQVTREPVFRRFYGVLRRVEHRGTVADHRLARVTMVPALWTLSQRSDARVFQDVTAVEVVQAVLREAGLYVGMLDLQLQRAYPKREYCVQYRETDLDFVLRLLASEGVTFFFRHEEEGETLVLADGAHAWEALRTMDGGPVPVAGPEGATHRVEVMRHLTWEREVKPTGVAVRDFDFTRPDFRLERMAPRRREGERNLYEPAPALTLQNYQNPAYTRDDAQEQAQLRLEAERVDEAVGSGEGNVSGMIPGAMFQLTMAGGHVPAQRYVIARVEHVGTAPDVLTKEADEAKGETDRYRNHFRCLPVEAPHRPARSVAHPTIAGLQTATVVGPAGEEIYTDEHGRIKVQFHWDRVGARDEHSSCWIRVAQAWAGANWGFFFIPRIGMEVMVQFLEGDPDRPMVTGCAFNGENRPPYPLPKEKTKSTLKTRSSLGGNGYNELRFEDLAGKEEIFLHAQKDLNEVVEHNHATTVHANQTDSVDGAQSIHVGGKRSVTVKGGLATLDVTGDYKVDASNTIEVQAPTHIKLTCGGSSILIEPSRITLQAGGGSKIVLDADALTQSSQGSSAKLDADIALHAQTGSAIVLNPNVHLTSKAKSQVFLDADARMQSSTVGSLTLTADATMVGMQANVIGHMGATISGALEATMSGGMKATVVSKAEAMLVAEGGGAVVATPAGVEVAGPTTTIAGSNEVNIAGGVVKIN